MATTAVSEPLDDPPLPLVQRRKRSTDDELDITPMIDCVFLLLIYFLVTSISDDPEAVELPKARHGVAVSADNAIILTLADRGRVGGALVYLADGKKGSPLPDDPSAQEEQVFDAVAEAQSSGKEHVLIKAEKGVHYRDVARVMAAAAQVEGMTLDVGVLESDE